jgi:hypothetical protein
VFTPKVEKGISRRKSLARAARPENPTQDRNASWQTQSGFRQDGRIVRGFPRQSVTPITFHDFVSNFIGKLLFLFADGKVGTPAFSSHA